MFKFFKNIRERKQRARESLALQKCFEALLDIEEYPEDTKLVGARLYVTKNINHPVLKGIEPLGEELEIGGRHIGWNQYSARHMPQGEERFYSFHATGRTVKDIKQLLYDREVQKNFVKLEYWGSQDALAEYARKLL